MTERKLIREVHSSVSPNQPLRFIRDLLSKAIAEEDDKKWFALRVFIADNAPYGPLIQVTGCRPETDEEMGLRRTKDDVKEEAEYREYLRLRDKYDPIEED